MPKFFLTFRQSLLLLVLLTGWLGFPAQIDQIVPQPIAQEFSSGHVLIKFKSGIHFISSLHTGNSSLDLTLAQAKAKSLAPVYTHDESQLIYRLDLADGVDLENALVLLRTNAAVAFAEPDFLARLIASPNDPHYAGQWGLGKIQAATAWDQTYGSPTVIIAVIDSGIDLTHPDLDPNLWINPGEIPGNSIDDDNNGLIDDVNGWNFVDGTNDVQDLIGHGSLVAGVAAARSNNSIGIAGVCGLCRIMPIKITQISGFANYSDIAAGINYAVAKGARVINLSVGGYANSQAVHDAVTNALNQNVVVVGGAGNDNKTDPFYPAAYDSAVAVAGTDSSDLKTTSSNFGAWVDLSAPGQDILSTTLGDYSSDSGTSYATPFVSGTAGLVLSLHPDWTAAMVRAQLTHTIDTIDSLNPTLAGKLGAGRLNAANAMQPPHPILSYQGYSGNGMVNLRPDFGSSVSLIVTLSNDWSDASGITSTLSSSDSFVTFTNSSAGFGNILSGQSKNNLSAFGFNIASGAGYNHPMPFTLEVSANGGAYTRTLNFTITTRSSEEVFSGTIDTDTVWTSDKTYKLTGNVGVDVGATLTIQPGTVVKFAGNYSLNIWGTLMAQGSAAQPIRFEPYVAGGGWNQISFKDESTDAQVTGEGIYQSGNVLQWVTVSGATGGVGCTNATPYLEHLITSGGGLTCSLGSTSIWLVDSTLVGTVGITQTGTDPISLLRNTISGGNVTVPPAQVSGSSFTGNLTIQGDGSVTSTIVGSLNINGTGDIQQIISNGSISMTSGQVSNSSINGGTISIGNGGMIVDNTINGGGINSGTGSTISGNRLNGAGIIAGNGSTISHNNLENSPADGIATSGASTITFNRVVGSSGKGIVVSDGAIENNLVANTKGDGLQTAAASIRNNTITGIQGSALYLTGVPSAFDHNNFEFNPGSYDVYVTVPKIQAINLLAQNNWWGTTDGSLIKQRTWDYYDDPPLAKLITTLPLNGPSQTAPGYVRGLTLNPPSPVGIQTVSFTAEFSRPMDMTDYPRISLKPVNSNFWSTKANMITPQAGLGVATVNGKVYAIGGTGGNTVEEFDPATNVWTHRTNMPSRRINFGVAVVNDKIYAIGGYGDGGYLNSVEEYNPVSDSWRICASMPTARTDLGVAAINGNVYAFGGRAYPTFTTKVEKFDPITNTWTSLANMPPRLEGLSAVAINGKIYVIGGYDNNSVGEYNPNTDTWTTKASMSTNRSWFGVAIANGRIYVMGGSGAGSSVEEYNPSTNIWTMRTSMLIPRNSFGSATVNGKIYAVGGAGANALSTVEEYTPPDWGEREVVGNPQWSDPTHYSSSYDFDVLIQRGAYLNGIQNGKDTDGVQIAPYTGPSFQVDYAGEISNTTPPLAPYVSAWGNGSLSQLSAHVTASGTGTSINGYRYAIGTTAGGADVVNWTNTASVDVTRIGLLLQAGQIYYVSFMARNVGGLWSPAGVSNGVKDGVAINNPQPQLTQLSLASVPAGSEETLLTITGSNYIPGSVVRWNATDLNTDYVDSSHLTVTLPPTLLTSPGSATITIFNPAPGGGSSSGLTFTITATGTNNPQPQLSQLSLTSVTVGSSSTLVTLTGSSFIPFSVVRWNGTDLSTAFIDNKHLSVTIPASLLISPGTVSITVFNPAPGGGSSSGLTFTVLGSGNSKYRVFLPATTR